MVNVVLIRCGIKVDWVVAGANVVVVGLDEIKVGTSVDMG